MRGLWLSFERDGVVRAHGELDGCTGARIETTIVRTRSDTVVFDMRQLTFMDCAGYSALLRARAALAQEGRSLRLRHACGEPAFLLGLISHVDTDRTCRRARPSAVAREASAGEAERAFNEESERIVVRIPRFATGAS